MANTAGQTDAMRATMRVIHTRLAMLDLEISSQTDFTDEGEQALAAMIVKETEVISSYALDLVIQAATIRSAVTNRG